MGRYKVTTGQNIYDVSLHIYGSIEGIVDLLINNETLSLSTELHSGDELIYTDDFVINADVVAYNRVNEITPAAGERSVYHKRFNYPKVIELHTSNLLTSVSFSIYGRGVVEMDWGDNSRVETILLTSELRVITHTFNSQIEQERRVYFYGDFEVQRADFTLLHPLSIYFMRPLSVEDFTLNSSSVKIDFISLFRGTYALNLSACSVVDLAPALSQKGLHTLNLTSSIFSSEALDNFLIGLVTQHDQRRSCNITLTTQPTGEYQQRSPPTTGMEAVWTLTHEPAWNESGFWSITIHNTTYTYEQ